MPHWSISDHAPLYTLVILVLGIGIAAMPLALLAYLLVF